VALFWIFIIFSIFKTNTMTSDSAALDSTKVNGNSRDASLSVGHHLDPTDWDEYRSQMHSLLDKCCDRMENYRKLPWKVPPSDFKENVAIGSEGISAGRPLSEVMDQLVHEIMPHATGNTHPQFMGWVHGGGIPSCVAADLVSSTMNSNCGGRNHGAAHIEVACIEWLCEKVEFEKNLTTTPFGCLTSGTSQATIQALLCARTKKFGYEVRKTGIRDLPPVRVYSSAAVHSCIARAMECLGHGSDNVVNIPVDPLTGKVQIEELKQRLEEDAEAGIEPLAIVGIAGSVSIGAYDDFASLADIAEQYNTWLHIDAAFGFWARLSNDPRIRGLTDSMHRADSIALDAHKWPGVQYDCGALIVGDKMHLRDTLALRPTYLKSLSEGLAGGDTWFTDYSLDLSRGFRALKFWTALQVAGDDKIGASITSNCDCASYMGELVSSSTIFELATPVLSNICCFYINPSLRLTDGSTVPDISNIATKLQLDGNGVFSLISIGDKQCLRAAIVNHRANREGVAKAVSDAEEALREILST